MATNVKKLTYKNGATEQEVLVKYAEYDASGNKISTFYQEKLSSTNKLSTDYISGLATVATSGSYNDLSNKPTIPTVNNGTLTLQVAGTTKTTFTANQSGNETFNVTASDLGLTAAMQFIGVSTTDPTSSSGATVSGHSTWKKGEVVIYQRTGESGYEEYIATADDNAHWELLGDADSYALKTVSISAGTGLTGGGNLSADRTISLADAYGDTKNPYASKTANTVLAAPNGSAGVPSFRALVAADIPNLDAAKITTGTFADARIASASTWNAKQDAITAGTGLSFGTGASANTLGHTNSVDAITTAGFYKVKYDAQGHITGTTAVAKSDITALGIPGSDNNTWRNIKVDGTEKLGTGTGTGAIDFVGGTGIGLSFNSTGNTLTIGVSGLDGLISNVTTSGSGNVVTTGSYSDGTLTLTKGITALTSHQSIKTLDTTATTAQTTSASEAIAGTGTIKLHKISKTGKIADASDYSTYDGTVVHKAGTETITGEKTFEGGVTVANTNESPLTLTDDGEGVLELSNSGFANVGDGAALYLNLPLSKADGTYTLATTSDITPEAVNLKWTDATIG